MFAFATAAARPIILALHRYRTSDAVSILAMQLNSDAVSDADEQTSDADEQTASLSLSDAVAYAKLHRSKIQG